MRQELGLPQVVCKNEDVFSGELLGLPPYKDVAFTIELHPGTSPISMTPYRMTLASTSKFTQTAKINTRKIAEK